MAELHIERKDRSIWPWVIGVLLLLALLWFVFGRGNRNDVVATDTAAPVVALDANAANTGTTPAAVTEFARYTGDTVANGANLAHDYTAEGLRRLADAIEAVAVGGSATGVDIQQRTAEIRQRADAMQRDPNSTEHALQAREAFLLASGTMRQMQEARFSGLAGAVGELNGAATAIQAERRLLDQTSEVRRFFERAAAVLGEMSRATT